MNFLKNKSITKVIILSISGFFILVCQDSTAKHLGNINAVKSSNLGQIFFSLCDYFNFIRDIKT